MLITSCRPDAQTHLLEVLQQRMTRFNSINDVSMRWDALADYARSNFQSLWMPFELYRSGLLENILSRLLCKVERQDEGVYVFHIVGYRASKARLVVNYEKVMTLPTWYVELRFLLDLINRVSTAGDQTHNASQIKYCWIKVDPLDLRKFTISVRLRPLLAA